MERLSRLFRLREGWLMVGLLALLLFSVTWAVQKAEWAEGLRILSPLTLIGLGVGLVLAKVRGVPRALLHATGLTAGALTTLWFTANLIETSDLYPTVQDKAQLLLGKTAHWLGAVVGGGMSDDIWVFIFALAALAYMLAYTSAWFLFRSRWLWWVLVPNGIALVVNLSYSSQSGLGIFFVVYMLAALLLMMGFNMLLHEERWERERVNYSPNLRWSFLWVSGLFAGAVAGAAWFVPPQAANNTLNAAWERVNGPWVDLQERFSRAFAGVNGGGNFGYSSFNDSFALGGSLNLGDTISLRIQATKPLYWRAKTFDQWSGIGWSNTAESTFHRRDISSKLSLDANQELISSDLVRQPMTVTVMVVQPKGSLIWAPLRPVQASIPTRLDVSWEDKDLTYRVPSSDTNPARVELELRPLVNALTEAKRLWQQTDQPFPAPGDMQYTQGILAQVGKDAEVNTEVGRLRERSISISYQLLDDMTFEVQAHGPFPQYDDVVAVYSREGVERGTKYTVVAETSNASQDQLRTAGTDYPQWITNRYWQLPPNITQRVRDLTRQIVDDAGARMPYDQAIAIQTYLRKFPYTTSINRPPAGSEYVDYFLFEMKTGYCEYYSSAMVVMLRTLGIPAREATGYAPGVTEARSGEYVIRESGSHAWAEVYFPQYGWIEFEPTPSQATITRLGGGANPEETPVVIPSLAGKVNPVNRDPDKGYAERVPNLPAPTGLGTGFLGLGSGGSAAAGGGVLFLCLAGALVWWLHRRAQAAALAAGRVTVSGSAYYERLVRLAWWVGLRPRPSETPFEFADDVSRTLPGSRSYVTAITQAYVNERWGRRKLDVMDQLRLDRAWVEVRRRLVRHLSNARRLMTRK